MLSKPSTKIESKGKVFCFYLIIQKKNLTCNCNNPRKINSLERCIPCLNISSTVGYNPVSAIRNKHSINFNERLLNKQKRFQKVKNQIFRREKKHDYSTQVVLFSVA